MPTLSIKHITTYQYRKPVAFGEHRMMLRPRDGYDQSLIDANLVITPTPISIRRTQDAFGNHLDIARFADRAMELRFESTIRLDHSHADIHDQDIEESARTYPFSYGAEEMPDLVHLIERKSFDPDCQVERWARTFLQKDRPTNTSELLIDLTHGIRRTFRYARRHEKGVQTPLQTLALGSGSCRDLAMLMIDAPVPSGWQRASSPDICTSPMTRPAAATPMPGLRSICPDPAGLISTHAAELSAIATLFASR